MANEITYICKRTAVSTKAIQPGRTHRLSALDRLMEAYHIRAVYYYRAPRGAPGELSRRLRESLAGLLTHLPAVTGRLVRDERGEWMVKCNDAGVRIIEAKAKGDVETWLEGVTKERELVLVNWEDMFHKPYFWSTFYAQLTEFEEGGLAVGLSCTHLLADPISLSLLIKAWADNTLCQKILSPLFFHPLPPRRIIDKSPESKPNSTLVNNYRQILQKQAQFTAQKSKTISFLFSEPMVQACIDLIQTTSNPFQALVGLFWAAISRVKVGPTNGLVDMSICMDARSALRLDKGFFGSCMVHSKVDGDGLDANNLPRLSRAVAEAMDDVDTESVKDLIEWLERDDAREGCVGSPWPPMDQGELVVFMDLGHIDAYSSVFEEGFEQLRASYHVEPSYGLGRVLVMHAPPSEGTMSRVVTVTLPGDEVHKICEDFVVSSFCPSILMNMV